MIEDFFSLLPNVAFQTYFDLPYSTLFDVWELLLKIANGHGISMLRVIFSNEIPVLVGPFDVIYRLSSTCFLHCREINITERGVIRVIS